MNFNSVAREFTVRLGSLLLAGILLTGFVATSTLAASKTIVFLGDSLTAGYGLPAGHGFPEQLAKLVDDPDINVVNAGVSGDTSASGLARLDWSVPDGTAAVVLELGANDALRAISPQITRKNLEDIVVSLQKRGIVVLLTGMKAPPNLGQEYVDYFDGIYPELAEKYELILYPFFLDNVAAVPELNQSDGIHPTSEGIRMIASQFLPYFQILITKLADE